MPSSAEATGQQSFIQAALDAGLNAISARQQVVFTRYQRVSLASDGSIFWVNTGAILTAIGSLHYATDREQDEASTLGVSNIIFTSESEVTQFSSVAPEAMWLGMWPIEDAPPLRVAFSRQGQYFREADLHHYSGIAILATMLTQIIDSPADIPAGPIVSNSLPIWLAQTNLTGQAVAIFPSFLVPPNLPGPYIAVHISPEQTESLAAAPLIGPWPGTIEPNSGASPLHELPASQLCRDEVTLTLYGFSNQASWQWWAALAEASANGTAPFGFANSPVIRDEKQKQTELAALAQKKTLHISANYNQAAADAVARRLILSAMVSEIDIIGGVSPSGAGAATQAEQTVAAMGSVFD
jgi:hypothetical protein